MVWEGTFNILVWCLPIATDFSGFSAGFFLSFSSGARGKILGGTILVSNTWKWVDLVNFTSYNPVSNYLKNNRSNRIFPGWIFRFHPRLDKIFGTLTVTDQVKLQSSSSCAALKMREIIISLCMGGGGSTWQRSELMLLSMAVRAALHNMLGWEKKERFGAYLAFTALRFSTSPVCVKSEKSSLTRGIGRWLLVDWV